MYIYTMLKLKSSRLSYILTYDSETSFRSFWVMHVEF